MKNFNRLGVLLALLGGANTAFAQSEQDVAEEDLLTQAELENLVVPVALFPDTLLIQILVASTSPMEIIKADRLLAVNDGEDSGTIEAAVDA